MPLYEYLCDKCHSKFEVIEKFSDEPLKVHKDCGGNVERLVSAPALQFKGTGWYVTDYAKSGSGKSDPSKSKPDSSKSGDSGGSSSSSSDTSSSTKSDSGSSSSSSTSSDTSKSS